MRDRLFYKSAVHKYTLSIKNSGCLANVLLEREGGSPAAVRDYWTRILGFIRKNHICHTLYVRCTIDGTYSNLSVAQNHNIARGVADGLGDIHMAIVDDYHSRNELVFAAGALEAYGASIARFTSIKEAQAWLEKQPHLPECPLSNR